MPVLAGLLALLRLALPVGTKRGDAPLRKRDRAASIQRAAVLDVGVTEDRVYLDRGLVLRIR